jgi:SWI/SNF-related matrix-associated actin-dependent regulator of chromatin subfamily A-like protein 1
MKTPLLPSQVTDSDRTAASEDLPNFSEPGTGKTISTLAAFEKAKLETGLVVCPVIAVPMWKDNIEYELGASVQTITDGSIPLNRGSDFHVVTYGLVSKFFDDLMQQQADALIVDESHYAKNWEADRTMAIFGPTCDGVGGLYSSCKQCWELTGTPIERYADDLWSQLRATQPEHLAHYNVLELKDFQAMFCHMMWKEYGGIRKFVSAGNQNTAILNRMLYKNIGIIRRTMDEVEANMPPVTFREVGVRAKISRELQALLKGLDEHNIMELLLQGGDRINSAHRLTGMAKVDDVVHYVKSIYRHRPVLLGFWHTDIGLALVEKLASSRCHVGFIDGSVDGAKREQVRKDFNTGKLDVLVGQISSMGVAMNLQERQVHVIFAEDYWSASKIEQFWKRAWRLGQKHHIQVDFCRAEIPVDTAVRKVREAKETGSKLILASPK